MPAAWSCLVPEAPVRSHAAARGAHPQRPPRGPSARSHASRSSPRLPSRAPAHASRRPSGGASAGAPQAELVADRVLKPGAAGGGAIGPERGSYGTGTRAALPLGGKGPKLHPQERALRNSSPASDGASRSLTTTSSGARPARARRPRSTNLGQASAPPPAGRLETALRAARRYQRARAPTAADPRTHWLPMASPLPPRSTAHDGDAAHRGTAHFPFRRASERLVGQAPHARSGRGPGVCRRAIGPHVAPASA